MKPHLSVALASLLPLAGIFATSDLHHTYDGFVHLARMAAYFKALKDALPKEMTEASKKMPMHAMQ